MERKNTVGLNVGGRHVTPTTRLDKLNFRHMKTVKSLMINEVMKTNQIKCYHRHIFFRSHLSVWETGLLSVAEVAR